MKQKIAIQGELGSYSHLAAKEIYIAKFYISTQKWVPAINRLKKVVKNLKELKELSMFH